MKNTIFVLTLIFSTTMFAQQEWGDVQKNTVTLKEIAPVWPGCEKGSATQRDNCFNTKLATHIAKNFKYPAAEYKNNVQGRVIVDFVINEKGMVEVKNVSGGTAALQEEAKRNIMAIPKMAKPGMLGGKPRAIKYSVPFTFKTGK
ncbi:energy transducer TonB [Constantimarinum furrinae]|uniref:Periplasmic protein TonB n=1 Tax=Constantimarinum furrinae TaxID=2562285 RepID=A0A7G8PU87_9FLAO|nr:energy transducer TonB [Constantimarinum furrinae]QNJ97903.1 periplasmic protein TonB [Constantimarinum furrinae]